MANKFPKSFGLLLFPQFEILDVAGPVEALNCLARFPGFEDMKLSIVSRTLEPLNPGPVAPDTKGCNFIGVQQWIPTHTYKDAPPLDCLIVPGGFGVEKDVDDAVAFIRDTYCGRDGHPPLQYLISVCNGTTLLARSGVLDGKTATTSKMEWEKVTALGRKTNWIAKARWVADGNIWTTSGVSAGLDGVVAWMHSLLPKDVVNRITEIMEYSPVESADNDPFAAMSGCKDVPPKE
jgi:transcriptional regulator GlxA family with amidase domain